MKSTLQSLNYVGASLLMALTLTSLHADDVSLLNERMTWKKTYAFFPAQFQGKDGAVKAVKPERSRLPKGWAEAGFDDYDWLSLPGVDLTKGDGRIRNGARAYQQGTDAFVPGIGLIAMRGKFVIDDPSEVKELRLSLIYRGGFIAYLNGTEIARASLPNGKIGDKTPSEAYPASAFYVQSGQRKKPLHWYTHRDKKYLPNWASRERNSGEIKVDPKHLIKGLNVLSLEMHRSTYPAECRSKKIGLCFASIGLGQLSLKAATTGSVAAKQAFRLWNAAPWETVASSSPGWAKESLAPVKIAAARNGTFYGQIIATASKGMTSIKVTAGDLTGPGKIPASNIEIMYGAFNILHNRSRFDLLLPEAPKGLTTLPIWLKVKIPADAAPGIYKGQLSVTADSHPTETVPVIVKVSTWKAPNLEDYTPPLFIYQSPDSLALHYKVPMWSEAHWKLIEKSLKLMGEFGNGGLIFPLMAESCMGNPHSMITWKKRADGSLQADYTAFDRYLKIAMKYHLPKRMKVVGINIWGHEIRYSGGRGKPSKPSPRGKITVVDANGKKSHMKLPAVGTPESEAIWRPVLTTIKKKLEAYGIADKLMYGVGSDSSPAPQQLAMFDKILPGTPWFRESHFAVASYKSSEGKKIAVGCTSFVWGGEIPDPSKKRLYGWKYNPGNIRLNFNRPGTQCLVLKGFPAPWSFRMWMESTITCGRNGNGRVGGDFFPLKINLKSRWRGQRLSSESIGGSNGTLFGSYPQSNVGQTGLGNNTTDLFGPGADGPVTTIRLENARAGNLEAEARICIERALLGKKLPTDLAQRCQKLLDARARALRMWTFNNGRTPLGSLAWRISNARLFDLAGEVQKALGSSK